MTASPATKRKLTPAEYLEMERASEEKHEFYEGEIFAMPGATEAHNLIVGNIAGELRSALRRRPCKVYPSDMKVETTAFDCPGVSSRCPSRRSSGLEHGRNADAPPLIAPAASPDCPVAVRWQDLSVVRIGLFEIF